MLKNPVEGLQVKFCKRLLCVSDKATNWAVLSECGRLPTIRLIIQRMLAFWYHASISNSPILRAALQTNADLAHAGRKCWFSYIQRSLKFLGIEHVLYTSDLNEVRLKINSVKKKINKLALEHWSSTHEKLTRAGGKLDLFCGIKDKFGMSHHLSTSVCSKWKSALSKFRVSAHNLPVETLRYSGLSRGQRICPLCCDGVGNEMHYFLECDHPRISELQAKLFGTFPRLDPNLSKINKVASLLSSHDPKVISRVGEFVSALMIFFREINTI